ncbi:MAG: cupin [Defluviitaleaceae bacterium]|jgi:mannose-6-phosphate isomerase-like protein (cupin superfamily)|nr:cupin [Defluviitaleaceae bacterium]
MKGMNHMYSGYQSYPYQNYMNSQMYMHTHYSYPYYNQQPMYHPVYPNPHTPSHVPFTPQIRPAKFIDLRDHGPKPFVVNIEEAAEQNNAFRTALWTGEHLQVTLMCIGVGEDIGLEVHPYLDQFIRIESGQGIVRMGDRKDQLNFEARVYEDYAFIIPAGKWHNLINTGPTPIKLYSIYAPPQHPHGTVHRTKADAEAAEVHHAY